MIYLTTDEHRVVLQRLVGLMGGVTGLHTHPAGMEYTSIMSCFAVHSKSAAESILALHDRFGTEWFPATTGYLIVRSLFEIDVNAHYIAQDRSARSSRYIDFGLVLRKKEMEAIKRHRASHHPSWQEAMTMSYEYEYAPKEAKIDADYERVRRQFENKKGKHTGLWSGKTLSAMAKDVDHLEAYDVFYSELSAFAHVSVTLANRFLRTKGVLQGDGPGWSQRASEYDVGSVFRYAATFLTCFLQLFGQEFALWDAAKVESCWDIPKARDRVLETENGSPFAVEGVKTKVKTADILRAVREVRQR